jgi:outer membrane protein assembly factor BamB
LPARFVDARSWQGAVLAADLTGLRLLDPASGTTRFAVDVPGRVRRMVSSASRVFLDTTAATVAVDDAGRLLWRAAVGSLLAADGAGLLTQDRSAATVRIGLHDTATGRRRWSTTYAVAATARVGPPPGGPLPDAPPGGPLPDAPPGGPLPDAPDAGPPLVDDDWARTEAQLGAEFVAVRDGRDVRVLRRRDGRPVWRRLWPTPIAALAVVGDLLLVAADRLTALTLATGVDTWQLPLRGARMAVSAGGNTVVVVAERTITAVDPDGTPRWQTDLPAAFTRAATDRISLDAGTAFVTFKPADQQVKPLDVDVVAVALGDA